MFIGRDGGGGGGEGGVCGANDGDREERGMFSPPPTRRDARASRQHKTAKKSGVTLRDLKRAAENWRLQRTNRTRIASETPPSERATQAFPLLPRFARRRRPTPERRLFIWGRESEGGRERRHDDVAVASILSLSLTNRSQI